MLFVESIDEAAGVSFQKASKWVKVERPVCVANFQNSILPISSVFAPVIPAMQVAICAR